MAQSVLMWLFLAALGASYFLSEAQTEGSETEEDDDQDVDYDDEFFEVNLFLRNQSGYMTKANSSRLPQVEYENFTKSNYLEGIEGLPLKNLSCIVYNHHHLQCSWAALKLPADAHCHPHCHPHCTLTVRQPDLSTTNWNCPTGTNGNVVACQAIINYEALHMNLQINVSLPDVWYLHSQDYDVKNIEKLNPPQNISMSAVSKHIVIRWDTPSSIGDHCFTYQLKINNNSEVINVTAQRDYTIAGADPTRRYSVQMRVTKTGICRINHIWSDWSDVLVMNPINPSVISLVIIVIITFCIPMLVLSVLLLIKLRICEKLFPPVPGPSRKIKILLEREDFSWKPGQTYSKGNRDYTMARCGCEEEACGGNSDAENRPHLLNCWTASI
ncbi:granulocyte-macrophage colony-stimulating factor receptor subunit alpha-like [Brienomyrus brachyistius]|uniref:granulocyte-macrophage colony-stimulating factor receptor subunit alpha-like n=1 Tax=Brienomyrus brachyistius TaxID=42636 RepID=UPI0020B3AC23|nr:granulocyte-macrophage colony-stimulating factor receptor subunit alpha-like [Brienomyrus brachyistius]XP_048882646.1 granulocyte-macrophage colony-stimulating factor receptor subunit alpha-like [Brienomyrus brachyistius]XP_048882655.1 granulocyte-macrophage colony-stimulating factor receptor subunit alpha-like [Brienomyrus brachyistius]